MHNAWFDISKATKPSFHRPRGGTTYPKSLPHVVAYWNPFNNSFVLIAVSIFAIFLFTPLCVFRNPQSNGVVVGTGRPWSVRYYVKTNSLLSLRSILSWPDSRWYSCEASTAPLCESRRDFQNTIFSLWKANLSWPITIPRSLSLAVLLQCYNLMIEVQAPAVILSAFIHKVTHFSETTLCECDSRVV